MGSSLYCFSKNVNDKLIAVKSDLNMNNLEEKSENNRRDSSVLITSNNKTTTNSPVHEQREIFINPLPDIVTLRPKKTKKQEN